MWGFKHKILGSVRLISGPWTFLGTPILLENFNGNVPASKLPKKAKDRTFKHYQYPAHDFETLGYLKEALDRFHKNQEYFIKTGVQEDFNIIPSSTMSKL